MEPRSLNPTFLSSLTQVSNTIRERERGREFIYLLPSLQDIQQSFEDYHSAKEKRSVFLPQHLLTPHHLPKQQLNK